MSEPLNFYVFITYDNLTQNSLRIPIEFTKEHLKEIQSNNIILMVSDNKNWPMSWQNSTNGQLLLQKGWAEFAEHYRIKIGHLLLFYHQGSSNFYIQIFDRNSCSITCFPFAKSSHLEKQIDQHVLQSDSNVEEIKDGAMNTELTLTRRSKNTELVPKRRSKRTELAPKRRSKRTELALKKRSKRTELALKRRSKSRACKSDKNILSVRVTASNLKSHGLYLSAAFCRRCLTGEKKFGEFMLQTATGRNLVVIKCKEYEKFGRLYGKNWKKFCDDKHLDVGDVCAFELINEVKKVLKVNIVRALRH